LFFLPPEFPRLRFSSPPVSLFLPNVANRFKVRLLPFFLFRIYILRPVFFRPARFFFLSRPPPLHGFLFFLPVWRFFPFATGATFLRSFLLSINRDFPLPGGFLMLLLPCQIVFRAYGPLPLLPPPQSIAVFDDVLQSSPLLVFPNVLPTPTYVRFCLFRSHTTKGSVSTLFGPPRWLPVLITFP